MAAPDAFAVTTIAAYATLVVLWSTAIGVYVRSYRSHAASDALIATLLAVLALDAGKSLFESSYFGALWASEYGLLPESTSAMLSDPAVLMVPKIVHVVVAIVVVAFLSLRWLPRQLEERRDLRRTEQELTEKLATTVASLEREKERWGLAIEATCEAIWEYDAASRRLLLGPELGRLLGRAFEPTTLDARAELRTDLVHPEDLKRLAASFRAALEDPTIRLWDVEYRLMHADGRPRPVHSRGVIQRGADGVAHRVVGTIADRTDHVHAVESRLSARKLESVGLLAGGIAHDFNNLLTAVLGNAGLAKSRIHTPAVALSHLELVEEAARSAAELTRQLLAYSGRGRIVVAPVSIDRVVRDIQRVLEVTLPSNVELETDLDSANHLVEGDVGQLQQVAINLVANAAEAMEGVRGAVHVRTRTREVDASEASRSTHSLIEPGRYVVLDVTDDGHGMSQETIERMFDPFFTTRETGRGLGLSAILGILRSHQSGLAVESVVGRGTRFTVYFPVSRTGGDRARTTPRFDGRPLAGRVLVVDDEEAVRVAASAVLSDLGLEVVTAEDGRAAIETVEAASLPFDLVLLDLTMPRLDGHSTLKHLRGLVPELPIVLSSGYSAQEVLARYANDARTSFLPKPWRAAHLVSAVRLALEGVSEGSPTP